MEIPKNEVIHLLPGDEVTYKEKIYGPSKTGIIKEVIDTGRILLKNGDITSSYRIISISDEVRKRIKELKSPVKWLSFKNNEYEYCSNKCNTLVYKGYYGDAIIVKYDPDKKTYYVLFRIIGKTHWSRYSDEEIELELENLSGDQRMAYPSKN